MKQRKQAHSMKKRKVSFTPDRNFIKDAVKEYENRGGRITKLETVNSYYSNMNFRSDSDLEVNEIGFGTDNGDNLVPD
jgi:hypothetical protein